MISEEDQIRSILKRWGKFPAHDEPDFDCLFSEVLTALNDGFDQQQLYFVIQNEFLNHIGREGSQADVSDVAVELSEYWARRNQSGQT